jgi:hypothetical protein
MAARQRFRGAAGQQRVPEDLHRPNVLYLVERAEPQKREDLLRNGLRLIEVRISVEGTRLREDKTLVAEIHPESDEVR